MHRPRATRTLVSLLPLLALLAGGCGGSDAAEPPSASHAHASASAGGHEPGGHHHGDGMPHRFDDAQAWAAEFDAPERDAWQQPDRVVEALALPPDAVVADLGAGTGYFSVRLARAVPNGRVLAIDVEPSMVRYLADRATREGLPNLLAVEGTATDSGLREPVDLVLVVDTYHHIADRTAYFARLRAQLRPGGRVVIVDFRLDSDRGPPREHKLAPEVVRAELEAAGLHQVASHDFLPDQYILVFEGS